MFQKRDNGRLREILKKAGGFHPPVFFSCLGAALFSALSMAVVMADRKASVWEGAAYLCYGAAAVFLILAVWSLTLYFREASLGQKLEEAARRTKITERMYEDYGYRTMITGHLSLAGNVVFALAKAAAGWYYSSVWLCALAGYYLILCIAKAVILRWGGRSADGETSAERMGREWKIYRLCGIFLILLTVTLQGVVILIVEQGKTYYYQGYLIFAVALYDFYCMITSIVFMVKTRKEHNPVIVSVKTIRFASSLVAMLTLQTAMFASFSGGLELEKQRAMNIITGTSVCAILILWGVWMVMRAQRELAGKEGRKGR